MGQHAHWWLAFALLAPASTADTMYAHGRLFILLREGAWGNLMLALRDCLWLASVLERTPTIISVYDLSPLFVTRNGAQLVHLPHGYNISAAHFGSEALILSQLASVLPPGTVCFGVHGGSLSSLKQLRKTSASTPLLLPGLPHMTSRNFKYSSMHEVEYADGVFAALEAARNRQHGGPSAFLALRDDSPMRLKADALLSRSCGTIYMRLCNPDWMPWKDSCAPPHPETRRDPIGLAIMPLIRMLDCVGQPVLVSGDAPRLFPMIPRAFWANHTIAHLSKSSSLKQSNHSDASSERTRVAERGQGTAPAALPPALLPPHHAPVMHLYSLIPCAGAACCRPPLD